MANGTILYQGPSQLTGEQIICVATWNSKNTKTGNMIQTWILLRDIPPHEAVKTGSDRGVCGNCPRSPLTAKLLDIDPCYVQTYHAPLSVWKAYHKGLYSREDNPYNVSRLPDLPIRLGSYGDPCAVPIGVWDKAKSIHSQDHTGYSHQWKSKRFQQYARLLMASCDTLLESIEAGKMGWRSFNVSPKPLEHAGFKFAQCPASNESNANKTCSDCMACNGRSGESDQRASIKILAH